MAATIQASWPSSTFERVTTISYTLVDEVHSLVDSDAGDRLPALAKARLSPARKRVAVCGLVLFGTLISTLGKLAYEVYAVGRDGSSKPFEKPWCMVLLMFVGMGMNLPLSLLLDLVRLSRQRGVQRRRQRQQRPHQHQQPGALYAPLLQYDQFDDEIAAVPSAFALPPGDLGVAAADVSVAGGGHPQQKQQWPSFRLLDRQLLLLLVPTLVDMAGAALLNIGLLSVTASATQMLRQSLLPFAALLGVGLWHKRLNGYHAVGLAGCLVGLGMVAAASLASGFGGATAASNTRGTMAVGIGMILLSQLMAAGQLLIDQGSWNARLQLSPLKVVGCEGLLGVVITGCIVMPLADVSRLSAEGRGLSEDVIDTVAMIASSPLLQLLLLVFTGSLQAYNIAGMAIAGELSAVDMTLLQAIRTLLVWVANLVIHAAASALAPADASDQQQAQQQQQQQQRQQQARGSGGLQHPAPAGGDGGAASQQQRQVGVLGSARGDQQQGVSVASEPDRPVTQQQQQGGVYGSTGSSSSSSRRGSSRRGSRKQRSRGTKQPRGLPHTQLSNSTEWVQAVAAAAVAAAGSAASVVAAAAGPALGAPQPGMALSAATTAQLVAAGAPPGLPGEPWLAWSFLQAGGFVILVAAALLYSRGDSERWRRQLEAEAALIMADQPPGSHTSAGSHGPQHAGGLVLSAHMDMPSSLGWRGRGGLYGITPCSLGRGSLLRTGSSQASLLLHGGSPAEEAEAGVVVPPDN